ncbi:MAG: helix-turn-helix domain-containing protein [candidate division Zixibacteria bacterium]|nr:helix-turn-helix domain-containing protein [candidate division Zixibacteria bacterium]
MEKLLTVEQIAEHLQMKPSTIYQWTHQGFIPYIKLGNRVRFKVSHVEKWLESRTNNGRSCKKVSVI